MSLYSQVRAVSTSRETKADIVEYFKEKYPHGWQARLVNGLFPFTDVKNAHNLSRRFNPDRIDRPGSAKEQREYKAFGEMLPPKPPPGGYHISGKIYVKCSDGDCEDREVDENVTGDEAKELAEMSYKDMAQAVTNSYMTEGDSIHVDEPMMVARFECGEPELDVEAIEEE